MILSSLLFAGFSTAQAATVQKKFCYKWVSFLGLDHRLAQMVMNEPPCQLCRASSIGASLAGRAEAFGSTVW